MAGPEGNVCKLCRYAQGMCQIGFRKSHERTDPQCRLHGVTGRASGAKSAPNRQASPLLGETRLPRPLLRRPAPRKSSFEHGGDCTYNMIRSRA